MSLRSSMPRGSIEAREHAIRYRAVPRPAVDPRSPFAQMPRVHCPHCQGRGWVAPVRARETCPYCRGRGRVVHADFEVYVEVRAAVAAGRSVTATGSMRLGM